MLHDPAEGPQDPGRGTSPSQAEGPARVMPGQTPLFSELLASPRLHPRLAVLPHPQRRLQESKLPEAKLGVGELCLLAAVCAPVYGGARVSPWGQGGCAEATSSSAWGKVGVCLQLGVSGAALPWMGLEDGCPRLCVSG